EKDRGEEREQDVLPVVHELHPAGLGLARVGGAQVGDEVGQLRSAFLVRFGGGRGRRGGGRRGMRRGVRLRGPRRRGHGAQRTSPVHSGRLARDHADPSTSPSATRGPAYTASAEARTIVGSSVARSVRATKAKPMGRVVPFQSTRGAEPWSVVLVLHRARGP